MMMFLTASFIRNTTRVLLLSIALPLVGSALCPGQELTSRRVLFLGNSVFYYQGGLYQTFEGFCSHAGLNYQAVSLQDRQPGIALEKPATRYQYQWEQGRAL